MIKLVSYNFVVFFVIANVFYWSIPVVGTISDWVKGKPENTSEYRSFLGFRHAQRHTVNANADGTRKVYFFGGSTMYGLGVSDAETIPSLVSAATGVQAENYGNIAYTAHQSLVLLLELLQTGHRPNIVVFYDGMNDVAVKCEIGMTPNSHREEKNLTSLVRGRDSPSTFTHYFRPVLRLTDRLGREISKVASTNPYDCDTDSKKADQIAENLLLDWHFAKLLTESFGGKFIGILQPVSYFSRTRLDRMKPPPQFLDRQYQAIYPKLRQEIGRDSRFYDLVTALDVDEPIFTDFNHLTAAGNRYVAARIAEILQKTIAQR